MNFVNIYICDVTTYTKTIIQNKHKNDQYPVTYTYVHFLAHAWKIGNSSEREVEIFIMLLKIYCR